jgi:membrane-associated protein
VFWVLSITLLGYFLGNVPKVGPFLSENIDFAIMAILAFSVIPIAYEWWRHRRHNSAGRRARSGAPTADPSDVEV